MNYLLLLMATLGISVQDILRKQLDRRGKPPSGATAALNFAISATVTLFFVIAAGFRLTPHVQTLPYALGFAVAYALTMGSSMLAVMAGAAFANRACDGLLYAASGGAWRSVIKRTIWHGQFDWANSVTVCTVSGLFGPEGKN